MRIEYYDADTHDLVRRDAYSQALVNALRERDEARAELAEVRRIVTETLPDLADQPDRETTVRRVAALAVRWGHEREAAATLRAEVERLRKKNAEQANLIHDLVVRDAKPSVPPAGHTTDIEAAAKAIADGFELHQGEDDTRTTEIVRDILREHTRPIDQTSPAVHTTDIEAASYDVCAANYPGGIDSDRAEEVLRKHTRPIDQTSPAVCAALPEIAPRFVRVKLPGWRHEMYSCKDMGEVQQMMRNDCIAALRAQGVEVEP